MNQKTNAIDLKTLMRSEEGFGREDGEKLFLTLKKIVERLAENEIVRLSMEGIKRTDASFPRISVVSLAKFYKTKHGFCLFSFENDDVLDNWSTAAEVESFPLLMWQDEKYKVLGPNVSDGLKSIFEFIQSRDESYANEVAKKFNYSVSNASNKLKKLFEDGYIWRITRNAESGGIEHVYSRLK